MASPQVEDGYTKIANELMDALCRIRIPGEARQVLDVIFRRTYGWNKKTEAITLAQFMAATGLKKPIVVRAIRTLEEMNLVVIKKDNDIPEDRRAPVVAYSVQKNYATWKPLSKKITTFTKESAMGDTCRLCGNTDLIEKHYVVPLRQGGARKVSNTVMLCPNCRALVKQGKIDVTEMSLSKKTIDNVVIEKDNDIVASVTMSLSNTITAASVSRCDPTRVDFKDKCKDNRKKNTLRHLEADAGAAERKMPVKKLPKVAQKPEYTPLFTEFWQAYPRKKNKKDAFEVWSVLGKYQKSLGITMRQVIDAVIAQNEAGMFDPSDDLRHCPHPETWLNQHRWEDEVPEKEVQAPVKEFVYHEVVIPRQEAK